MTGWPACPSPNTGRSSSAAITSGTTGRWRRRSCCCWSKCYSRNENASGPPNAREPLEECGAARLAPTRLPRQAVRLPRHPRCSGLNHRSRPFCPCCSVLRSLLWPRPPARCGNTKPGTLTRHSRNTSACSGRTPTIAACISTPVPPPTATGNSRRLPGNSTPRFPRLT